MNAANFKDKAMQWANSFNICCFLDSNGYADPYGKYDWLLAAGAKAQLKASAGNAFQELKNFYATTNSYLFGWLSYELKNEVENLTSSNIDELGFPDLFFFAPEYLIASKNGMITVLTGDLSVLTEIENTEVPSATAHGELNITPRMSKAEYLEGVNNIRQHIKRGDSYELNFCQEFFARNADIDPLQTFKKLNGISPTPFAGYFKVNEHYILSATPERYLSKQGTRLTSQPIKGTAKRIQDASEDEKTRENLRNNPKERAENVMIVDLVRHDLTKSALKGTVVTEELFGVYSFPQVHQLISTISCTIDPAIHFIDAIKNSFPMGSMTGAPKLRSIELIEQYEHSKRGIYSGTFGWIGPDGDFDFNVVIRSILYNAAHSFISYHVGGAITYASDPLMEYEECMIKASAITQALSSK